VLGWNDDVATFYDQVEVILVPLLTGTGVSVKAMEAAAHGAALVTTTIGMRGLDLQPGQDLLVADDPEAFIAAVLRVLDDSALKLQLRRNAQLALRRHHSRDAFARGVAALLQTTPVAARTTLTASGANPQ
jgi:glycosyltransferase involved in cell wall biosynthesis